MAGGGLGLLALALPPSLQCCATTLCARREPINNTQGKSEERGPSHTFAVGGTGREREGDRKRERKNDNHSAVGIRVLSQTMAAVSQGER